MANFCTLNSLRSSTWTFREGNLQGSARASGDASVIGTLAAASGKFYYEYLYISNKPPSVGWVDTEYYNSRSNSDQLGTSDAVGIGSFRGYASDIYVDNVAYSGGLPISDIGSVVMTAIDLDTKQMWFGRDGIWFFGDPEAGTGGASFAHDGKQLWTPFAADNWGGDVSAARWNFGQYPFKYAPAGFSALSVDNLAEPVMSPQSSLQPEAEFFKAQQYTGNGGTKVVDVGFAPDMVWIKNLSNDFNWRVYDSIRGDSRSLQFNQQNAESTYGDFQFTANGFQFISDTQQSHNSNGDEYIAYSFKAGGTAVINQDGDIDALVSANTQTGLSIIRYFGDGDPGSTVGHGLGTVPSFITCKPVSTTGNWNTRIEGMTSGYNVVLSGNGGQFNTSTNGRNADLTSNTTFGFLNGNSTVNNVNGSGTEFIAYCFAEVEGFSKFGVYRGTSDANGPFVHTGFKPRFVVLKRLASADSWFIWDTIRSPLNPAQNTVRFETNGQAADNSAWLLDIVSNGFKLRNSFSGLNVNDEYYVYMAFAEQPLKYSSAR